MKNDLCWKGFGRRASTRFITAAVTGLVTMTVSGMAGAALADEPPIAMAPPVGVTSALPVSSDVFQWSEIPENQQVPLTRAVFDQGGYQLFDKVGETIVVPFANQNLYVMKFAVSPDNTLYFVNENGTPVLYVPRNGYLENATVSGAKWYPFSEQFAPTQPVFLGVAPSYTEFVDMGWYPSTVIYGGYYGSRSFLAGGIFAPTFGLTFIIGGHPYHNWADYHHQVIIEPAPYHIRYVNERIYRSYRPEHEFHGFVGFHEHPVASGHVFHGVTSHPVDGFHFNGGHFDHNTGSTTHVFQGTAPRINSVNPGGNHSNAPTGLGSHGTNDHGFRGAGGGWTGGEHTSRGDESHGRGGDVGPHGDGGDHHH